MKKRTQKPIRKNDKSVIGLDRVILSKKIESKKSLPERESKTFQIAISENVIKFLNSFFHQFKRKKTHN